MALHGTTSLDCQASSRLQDSFVGCPRIRCQQHAWSAAKTAQHARHQYCKYACIGLLQSRARGRDTWQPG
eukprot:1235658-Lingulodinium_polyedra.AAC.1